MKNYEETVSTCALNKIFGFEPKIGTALLEHFGSAAEVMRLTTKEQELLLGPHSKYTGMITPRAVDLAAKELNELAEKSICFLGQTQEHYPILLKECEDAPIGLYIRSSTPVESLFTPKQSVAVVGTRDISLYGEEWCCKVVKSLANSLDKPLIVSGLALGTDIRAHTTALDSGLPTIGVMATGPEQVYPWRHRDIAERMVNTPGCALITDYPPGTAPLAIHFLRRNRIIAGLSQATLLIESKIRGGGMMTCRLAFSYGRDVYALPGRVDDLRSQGCNLLIREKIAEPITSERELLKSLGFKATSGPSKGADKMLLERRYSCNMPEDKISQMANILLHIKAQRGITIEEISEKADLGYSRTAELARILEIDGFICIDLLQRCTINFRNNM